MAALLCLFSIQVEELRSRLMEAEKFNTSGNTTSVKRNSLISNGANGCPPALPEKLSHYTEVKKENKGTQMTDSVPASGVIVCFQI